MLSAWASVEDFRAAAKRRLPHFLFEYYDSSSFGGTTSVRNRADLDAVELVHATLSGSRGVSAADRPDTRTCVLGQDLSMPVILSPVGLAGMAWPRGESAAAKAADKAGIVTCLSTTSVCDIREVARQAPPWLQLYLLRDRGLAERMLATALEAGCKTLVLTVDTPVLGIRWRDFRSGLNDRTFAGSLRRGTQIAARPRWAAGMARGGLPVTLGNVSHLLGGAGLAQCMAFTSNGLETNFDSSSLQWVRENWPHRLIVKGVTEAGDARLAVDLGYDGIVVSNHGGRQLDGARSSIRSLVAVADAVAGQVPLLVDSGIRSGVDIVKALALGASAVMFGRPWVYALGAAGGAGVTRLLDCLRTELEVAMTLCGVRSIQELRESTLARKPVHWAMADLQGCRK